MDQRAWESVRSELEWLVGILGGRVAAMSRHADAVRGTALAGLVIPDGEVSRLVEETAEAWGRAASAGDVRSQVRGEAGLNAAERLSGRLPSEKETIPLLRAFERFELDLPGYIALLLALGVEVDGRMGRIVAYLNDHAARVRPTVGLAVSIAAELGAATTPVQMVWQPCIRDGLLEVEGEAPIPDLALRVAPELLARLIGAEDAETSGPTVGVAHARRGMLGRLVLSEPFRRRLESWVEWARRAGPPAVTVLVGEPGSGRRTLAHALASELGRALVWAEAGAETAARNVCRLRREARWHRAAALVRTSTAAGTGLAESLRAELRAATAPVFIATTGAEAGTITRAFEGSPVLDLPRLEDAERAQLWAALAPRGRERSADEGARLAARFRFNPGKIQRASRLAVAQRALKGGAAVEEEDLAEAARSLARGALEGLAERLELPYLREQLVVPEHVGAELSLAMAWITQRKKVMEEWGLGRRIRMGRGLTMLFCGPPGTGKTMAAQVMARELGVDLYRLDLASVMSKYIGETEKNLKRLFREAEDAGAAVLVDECEVLLSKRAEVKDARDKYANAEVGALLVLLEEFDGVSFLATNRGGDLDEAFTRRLPFIISFPAPDEAERRRIWEGLLPREVVESGRVDVGALAKTYKLTGGEIKNAVLAAAYAAAGEGALLTQEHLADGVKRELRKAGKAGG